MTDRSAVTLIDEHLSSFALVITHRNVVQLCVAVEDFASYVVDRKSIGPSETVHDLALVGAVHIGAADVRVIAPVGPEEHTVVRIHHDRSRLLQILADQHLSIQAVQLGNLDRVLHLIAEVQIARHPVDRQSVRTLYGARMQRLLLLTALRVVLFRAQSLDGRANRCDVAPVDARVLVIEIERHGVGQM